MNDMMIKRIMMDAFPMWRYYVVSAKPPMLRKYLNIIAYKLYLSHT